MGDRWFILADDLTGAADAASAFARRGAATLVGWEESRAANAADVEVFAYDADTRRLSGSEAATRQVAATRRFLGPQQRLYKKIDSTLRGQPAAEIAALCAELRRVARPGCAIFAPANPAMGRTTREGRVFVQGVPLEDSEIWRREHSYANADLAAILAAAGLRTLKLPLSTVRGAAESLRGALAAAVDAAAREDAGTVLICDAESDDDLARIAAASCGAATMGFYVGTAGFAQALAAQLPVHPRAPTAMAFPTGAALIVVGSLASVSQAAARELELRGVFQVAFPASVLLSAGPNEENDRLCAAVAAQLAKGSDVLVEIAADEQPDLSLGPKVAYELARRLSRMPNVSGLIATGGETAVALLKALQVDGIRLLDEIEAGVSLGVTQGEIRIPVITKPGGFGDRLSLMHSLATLRRIRHTGTMA